MAAAFVIVGAGSIGCHVGGRLAAAGATVILVARGRRAEDLRGHGLTVASLDGDRADIAPSALTVVATPAEAAPLAGAGPLVILATKTGATTEAASAIGAAFPAGTAVLSLQNGVDNTTRIRAAAPAVTALAGMVPFNVTLDHDATGRLVARRTTSGEIHAEDAPILRTLAPVFAKAGLPLSLASDMAAVQWGKLLLNLNNPVNALSGLPLRDELMNRDYRRALALLMDEALGLLKAAGQTPAKAGAAPPRLIPFILRLPTWAFSRIAASMLSIDPAARSSMADDLAAGRPTEIDDLSGAVIRLATSLGRRAPANEAALRLITAHRPGERLSGPAVLNALQTR